jgi:hypothetical protein
MSTVISIIFLISTAYTVYSLGAHFYVKLKHLYLRHHINEGSENYKIILSQIRKCIESGELNYYFDGFQLSRIDRTQDSDDLKDLQSGSKTLTDDEKYKIKIFSINLLNKIHHEESEESNANS